jgi:hypothetical protein
LLHGDFEPDHILVATGRVVVVDWGEACIGDPAYDVGWTYHKLTLERAYAKMNLGKLFVEKYEEFNPGRLVNLQFYKDIVAIEIAMTFGLSPFGEKRSKNWRNLAALIFGDLGIGQIVKVIFRRNMRRRMASHHTSVWSDVSYIQNYALKYLERDTYTKQKDPQAILSQC